MKKLHLWFGIAAAVVCGAGLVHGTVAWLVAEASWDPLTTSFPAWAAFVLPLPFYAAAAAAVLAAWLLSWLFLRKKKTRCKKRDGVL